MTDTDTTYDPETGGRDMIDLGGKTTAKSPPSQPVPDLTAEADALDDITTKIVDALKTVYDPEIPVDIYELGLVYKVDYEAPDTVKIEMTLTAPGCPVAGEMPGWVEMAVKRVDGIKHCEVSMTFDPPWTADRMSDEAKLELGWM
ncbi:SUF system Fe-S cluster assembly protein [Parvularcula sp. LCG005]|uniref:SUF system Fe-S cluster assembly protein n=1 Tax=Parvularcula sp. LCG005 TaxID=3078805 RepID=UPI002942D504|nr:SUF system Fe-S cluster assembly protein [Parvularcula sp. LCG005]WOI54620.1 SUF system Fe-S cluster assembly protein [Parvularcula sp. LCG005]